MTHLEKCLIGIIREGVELPEAPGYTGLAKSALLRANQLVYEAEKESEVLNEVRTERFMQDGQWGEQNHDPFTYLAILGEEVGEANQAALHLRFPSEEGVGEPERRQHYREELIQVAAVAVAMVECLDRNKWRWNK